MYNKNSVPIGVGNRDCAGQSLAMRQLFAFFGNLLLRYKIEASIMHENVSKLKHCDANSKSIVCTLNEAASYLRSNLKFLSLFASGDTDATCSCVYVCIYCMFATTYVYNWIKN